MIVCVCRNISDKHYSTQQQLLERLVQSDAQCCRCIQEIQRAERESRNQNNGKQIFCRPCRDIP